MEIATRIARCSILVAFCLAGVTPSWGQEGYQFEWPASVAVDGAGNVYVAEMGRHRVHKYDLSGSLLWRFGGMGPAPDQFNSPSGIAVDSSDRIYVADTGNARVQVLYSSGVFIARWGSFPRWGSKPGGSLRRPVAIALDGDNYVYVLDAGTRLVHKFGSTGAVYLGSWGGAAGIGDGQFNPSGAPPHIAIESKGNNSISAYISDTANHRIHKWAIGSDAVGNITSSAFVGWMGRCVSGPNCDVPARDPRGRGGRSRGFQCTSATCSTSSPGQDDGQFFNPLGVAVDSGSNVYVADAANERIQKFDSAGRFVTKWGSRGEGKVEFRTPVDVATMEFRGSRNATRSVTAVYVADSRNGRIVRFTNAGDYDSVLGGGIAVSATRGWVSSAPGRPPAVPDSLLDPNTLFMFAGETKTSTLTVKSLGLFSGSVNLTPQRLVDLVSGTTGTPSGVTFRAVSPSSLTVSSGSSKTAIVTIDTSTSNKGRFLLPIQIENQSLGIRRDLSVAFEIIAMADDSLSLLPPCPTFYQRSSTPEVLRLADVIKTVYAGKEKDLARGSFAIAAKTTTTPWDRWQLDFEKPTGVTPPLGLNEAFVVMNNTTEGVVGLYAINGNSCGVVPVFGLVLDPGQSGQMRISTTDTTTLVFSRPYQDIAVFAEPNFWTLFGGRKVTIRWFPPLVLPSASGGY